MRIEQKYRRSRNFRVSNRRQRRQQHLLDVTVRTRKAIQHRNRRLLVFLSKIALTIALGGGLYLGARAGARRFFFDNPDYRLTTIEVQTDGMLQHEQILQTAGLEEGENIFRVNLALVQDRLQQLPQVDEV
jgi:cell division septal protein FtsQ